MPVIVVVVAGGLLATLLLLPLDQSAPITFGISDPGDPLYTYVDNQTFAHAGTFDFVWNTNDGGSVNFTIIDPSNVTVYNVSGPSGLGTLPIPASGQYTFGIFTQNPENVSVSGTYHFTAPLLAL